MGQRPRALNASASVRHLFGAELRRLREQADRSQAQLGSMICFSADLVRVETADRFPSQRFAEACDVALGTGGALASLWPRLQEERSRPLVPVTGSHLLMRVPFQPGVLEQAAAGWLAADARSQAPLTTGPPVPSLTSEEDLHTAELALAEYRAMDHTLGAGSVHTQVQQYVEGRLNRLLAAASATREIHVRLHTLAAGFFELCGYQAVDTGADGLAQRRYLRALRLAQSGNDRTLGSYLLAVSLGHLSLHCGYPQPALRTALAALHGSNAHATPAVRAALHAVVARAHARVGNEAECNAYLRVAERQLTRSRPADEPVWIHYFTPAYLADEMAHCFHDLGRPVETQRQLRDALVGLQPSHVRRLAIDNALLASSLAAAGQLEEACTTARIAIDHAAATTSYRCMQRIVEVQADLDPYRGERPVRELGDYVRWRLPAAVV